MPQGLMFHVFCEQIAIDRGLDEQAIDRRDRAVNNPLNYSRVTVSERM